MATLSNELFLYVCVKHANGGKINFVEVAKECGIKSGAASMRWSRFVKKLDTSPLANSGAILGDSNEENGTNGEDSEEDAKEIHSEEDHAEEAQAERRRR